MFAVLVLAKAVCMSVVFSEEKIITSAVPKVGMSVWKLGVGVLFVNVKKENTIQKKPTIVNNSPKRRDFLLLQNINTELYSNMLT